MGELLSQYDVVGAFLVNVQLTLYAGIFALVLGTILAVMRVSPAASLRWAGTTYVNVVRNTPLTLIILGCSLGLFGQMGVVLARQGQPGWLETNSFRLAVLGLGLYTASFVCESLRSGINTVPQGQAEAARAIGLTFFQTMGMVILPQAVRGAIAPLGNTLIALAKNSTVAGAAGVVQAASLMSQMFEFNPNLLLSIFALFAVGWVALVLPLGILTTWLSRRLVVSR